ncbi:ATP-binding protein [Plastoroseomonas arctica]|nr:ATP-binding protein [Plastoroseomonas arctica]
MDTAVPFQLRVSGDTSDIVAAEKKLQGHLEEAGVPGIVASRAVVVLEEVVLNACRHGGATEVEIEVLVEDRGCTVIFEDAGKAFDPLSGQFAETAPASMDDVGGRGLLLIRRSATRSTYARVEERNRLVLEFTG